MVKKFGMMCLASNRISAKKNCELTTTPHGSVRALTSLGAVRLSPGHGRGGLSHLNRLYRSQRWKFAKLSISYIVLRTKGSFLTLNRTRDASCLSKQPGQTTSVCPDLSYDVGRADGNHSASITSLCHGENSTGKVMGVVDGHTI